METSTKATLTEQNGLTSDEKDFLDKNGYVSLGRILTEDQLEIIRQRIQELMDEEGEKSGSELLDSPYIRHPKEEGADRLADLVNKGDVFDIFYSHPRVLAGVAHVLGTDFKLSSLNYRAALPGKGNQKLHADWHEVVEPGDFKVCNTIWLLDDFTPENGATRLVAGTHLSGILPQEDLDDPWATHPDQKIIEAPAGTVVIFNSHTWHGGTDNHTNAPRRSIHSYFCRRDQPQQVDQQRYIRPETFARLSEEARRIVDVTKPEH
jgi:ectoine hydroxylase-related dioxygenase (phytanoyl-CoA dioxygenase family)